MAEEQEIVRQNFNTVTAAEKDRCIKALKAADGFSFKSFLPVTGNCHFERYNFVHSLGKLGIVFDTKAQILSFTARKPLIDVALACSGMSQTGAKPTVAQDKTDSSQQGKAAAKSKKAAVKPAKQAAKPAEKQLPASDAAKKSEQPPKQKKENKPVAKAKNNKKVSGAAVQPAPAATAEQPEYKDGFSIKKCPPQRLDGIIKKVRALKGITVTSDSGKEIVTYTVSDKFRNQKCLLRYITGKQTVQLQGKRSNLFGEVQVILSSGSGFSEAVGAHIELTGEQMRMSAIQRGLKKLLPDAFGLLSEQSKIDLGIGMIDINDEQSRLSDYSGLLVPSYRGLERFIYDLQQARGISVKMIGQAYEKDEAGKHVLKACYRRKNGIVYSEVMSALYNEYFENRNFYMHSDNSESGGSRFISEKSAAKAIFDNLCKIIDYNGKKLKEIGFAALKEKN